MPIKKILPAATAAALLLIASALFLAAPSRYASCLFEGIALWATSVLPSAFFFLFATAVLTRLSLFPKFARLVAPAAQRAFRISGAGACAVLLAMISGYPVGARSVSDLHESGRLGQGEIFRLSCLATTSGPAFLVGVVGGVMWKSAALGWLLLLCHFLGVWTVSLGLRFLGKRGGEKETERPPLPAHGNALYDSLVSSVTSVLCVGGSIALFYVFGQMIADVLPMARGGQAEAVLRGLVEMTAGCARLAQSPSALSLALSCFLVTFGGACVLFQQLAFLSRAGVKALPFLAVKLLQASVAGGLCFALALLAGV